MKVPLLQKIDIQDISIESIKTMFDRNPIGIAPVIFVLDEAIIEQRELFAKNCLQVFRQRAINPFFPFPSYILCSKKVETQGLPQLYKIEEAPKHFIKKIKRVKSREQTLLTKAQTYQSRIQNHSVTEDLEYLEHKREDNRKLRDLCYEKNFYINLIEKMATSGY